MVFAGRIHNKARGKRVCVDSGASMHMVSMKDLNFAELESVRGSKSLTTVVTANGEVRTKKEATVYVRELDLLVTVMLLTETPAVLLLGKLCEDHGYNNHWTSGQKTHLIKNGRKINCNTANYVPFVVLGLSTSSSTSSSRRNFDLTCSRPRYKRCRTRIVASIQEQVQTVQISLNQILPVHAS